MNIEDVRYYCLTKKGSAEDFPFGDNTSVLRVGSKIFALINLDGPPSVNLKCNPLKAIELREKYPSVMPGYHMNKKHWNTVMLDGSLPKESVVSLIDHSYELVLNALPEKLRNEINNLNS